MPLRRYCFVLVCLVLAVTLAGCESDSPSTPITPDPTPTQPLPTVAGIDPGIGSADGGTVVTITGTNFQNATQVLFGENPATAYTVNAETTITAIAPAGTAGGGTIVVTTPGGTNSTTTPVVYTWDENVLLDLAFERPTVTTGQPVRATVTLKYAAPSAGLRLPLTWQLTPSRSAAALFPTTVFVPSGSVVGSFQVTTFFTSGEQRIDVTSEHGGASKTATVVMRP